MVLIQFGQGRLVDLVTIAGLILGTVLYPWVYTKYLGWDEGSCTQ